MRCLGNVRLLRITDARIAIALGLIAAVAGWASYLGPRCMLIDVTRSDLEPAALWASGYGYSHATVVPPALSDFLGCRTSYLDPHDLPKSMPLIPANDQCDIDRIYLAYAIGIIWRVFGIEWAHLPILVGIGAGLTTVLLYAIFRLGMGRGMSVAGALLAISSPLMLVMFPCLRDFWKGPFILATILGVGYLLARPIRRVPFLLLSLSLGIAIGIGYGIRQDGIICLPPALLGVALFPRAKEGRIGLGIRLLGVVLLLGSLGIVASPVLVMIRNTSGNNALYLLQGHAIYCQETMEMRRACYAPIAQTDDVFVWANVRVHNARSSNGDPDEVSEATGIARILKPITNAIAPPKDVSFVRRHTCQTLLLWQGIANLLCAPMIGTSQIVGAVALSNQTSTPMYGYRDVSGVEKAGRHLLLRLVTTFPADVISRCYAATVHVVHGMRGYAATSQTVNPVGGARGDPDNRNEPTPTWRSLHLHIERHLAHYGEYYAIAALIIISMRSIWMALGALGLMLYFCGYVGLYFQDRHAYHLEFFAFWFPAFCLECGFGFVRTLLSAKRRQEVFFAPGCFHRMLLSAERTLIFLAIAIVALSLPLCGARLWQWRNVNDILRTYRTCQLDPIPFEEKTDPDGTLYYRTAWPQEPAPLPWPLLLPGVYTDPLFGLLYDYYVAEFETPKPCTPLTVRVLYEDCVWDCICSIRDDYDEGSGKGPFTVRYFFPAYQHTAYQGANHRFKGFSLPPGISLKNLYRVRNQKEFPVPMNLWLFEEPGNSRWYQAVPLFGTWI